MALELAATHPDWVAAVAVVGTAAPLHFSAAAVDVWQNVACGRAPQPFTPDQFSPKTEFALMRELWMEQVKTDPRVRWTDMLACNAYDGAAGLAKIAQPALVVAGSDDALAPPAAAESLQRRLPNARFVCLEDAGHCAPTERADAFNAGLEELLARMA